MKKLIISFLITGLINGLIAQSLRVEGVNAKMVCSGNVFAVLNNLNFVNNASSTMLTASTGEFIFTGNANSSITSTGPFNTSFYNVEVNKTGGAEINVTTNNMTITASNILEMVSGNIDMNNNLGSKIQLGTSTANLGTLTRTTGHVYNGYFQKWYSTAGSADLATQDIPLGMNASSYNFARFFYTIAPTTGGTLRARFVPTAPFYTGLPIIDATNNAACGSSVELNNCANEGYWEINAENGLAGGTYTVKLNYNNFSTINAATENCLRVIKSEIHTSWLLEGTHGAINVASDFVTRTGQTGFSLFTVASDFGQNPLPIELVSFDAECTNNSTIINWVTATENNNDYFVIERSENAIYWDLIANVSSKNGNSNTMQNYTYNDNSYGNYYYKLSQVDINGDATSFNPVNTSCLNTGTTEIINAINTNGNINITLSSAVSDSYTLNLFDIHGKKISVNYGDASKGINSIIMPTEMLRNAYYIIQIQIGDKILSKKVLVISQAQ